MKISVAPEELTALKEGLDAYLPELEREVVRSDVHSTQHLLNMRWEHLSHLRQRLDEALVDQDISDSESPLITGTSVSPHAGF